MPVVKDKGHLVQKLEWKPTDRQTEAIAFITSRANAVSNNVLLAIDFLMLTQDYINTTGSVVLTYVIRGFQCSSLM